MSEIDTMEEDLNKKAAYEARDKILESPSSRINSIQVEHVSRGWMKTERRWRCYWTDKYSGVSTLWKTASDLELIEMADQL